MSISRPRSTELFGRMASDARLPIDTNRLDGLLALQTRVLASRLALGDANRERTQLIDPMVLERHRGFRSTVEREFRRWHLVGPYARYLGYSPKTLDRACRAAAAMTAKRVIVERIVLEAKRLLAHSQLPVAAISVELGFDEATNFVKYFRRETGTTPHQFRVWPPSAASEWLRRCTVSVHATAREPEVRGGSGAVNVEGASGPLHGRWFGDLPLRVHVSSRRRTGQARSVVRGSGRRTARGPAAIRGVRLAVSGFRGWSGSRSRHRPRARSR